MRVVVVAVLSSVVACASQDSESPERVVGFFKRVDLVSDQPGAAVQDPTLVDAWGISLPPIGGSFAVSASATGIGNLYAGDVGGSPITKTLSFTIPGGAPSGTVFNSTPDFVVASGAAHAPAPFLFATQTGAIVGWTPAVPPADQAHVGALATGAAYTGIAFAQNNGSNLLYAADSSSARSMSTAIDSSPRRPPARSPTPTSLRTTIHSTSQTSAASCTSRTRCTIRRRPGFQRAAPASSACSTSTGTSSATSVR